MLLSLKCTERDVNLSPFINLNHELDKEGRLGQHTEIDTSLTHLERIFQTKIDHDPRDPEDSSHSLDADVTLILLEPPFSVCVHSVEE